jgi:serine/threonine-protein kinase
MAGADLLEGTLLAGYRIVRPVGRGGMGVVYRAEEPSLGRSVALKVLAPALAGNEEFRRRFLREMQLAASIEHPNILPVYRAGEDQGLLYLAMRYVEAADLRQVLDLQGPLDPVRALDILDQVARALDAAHGRGLVHRDVKPGNILLAPPVAAGEREHIYLVDFGLARPGVGDASITGVGLFVGTPSYMAPEQLGAGPLDGRTDVYALGCVLFECLTGTPPFTAERHEAVLFAHVGATPPKASRARPGLPPALDAVIGRALAKDPQERYRSCGELAAAARAVFARPPAPAGPRPEEPTVPDRAAAGPDPARLAGPRSEAPTRVGPASPTRAPSAGMVAGERAGRLAGRVGRVLGVAATAAAKQALHPEAPPAPRARVPWPPPAASPPARAGPAAPARPSTPAAPVLAYQPLGRAAARARRALWLAVALAAVGVGANLADTAAARSVWGDPTGAGAPGRLAVGVSAAQALVFVLTAVLFLAWSRRAYANVGALGVRSLRFARWWVVAGWLVPVFSLFRPRQVLGDIWRASDPDLPAGAGERWRDRRVPVLLDWWWLAFLASTLARSVTIESVHALTAFMTFGLASRQLDRFEASAGAEAVADLLTVVAGLLALRMVAKLTARQEARAARLAGVGR